MSIPDEIRQIVSERAKFVCEYCHFPEKLSDSRFTLDHLIPVSLGGSDNVDNLALACRRCNERRYNFVEVIDPKTQEAVPIFNPRKQYLSEHFVWTKNNSTEIKGITSVGQATCDRLDLNDMRYPQKDSIRATRLFWIQTGLHPPDGDVCEV